MSLPKQGEYRYVQGKLYVRENGASEMKLEFEEPGDKPFCTLAIARLLDNERSELHIGRWAEFLLEQEGQAGCGRIVRRPATDDDIEKIVMCWQDRKSTLKDFLDFVNSSRLDESEKERIRRACSKRLAHT